ncbi:hypothetical protein FRB93_005910 [Tulasnella sp. JGI-2019a]|nr:hypothetical protein FRB93_005910 [Tulasnella sp. JGI-2019a]
MNLLQYSSHLSRPAPFLTKIHYGNIPSPEVYEVDDPRAPQVFPITRSLFEVLSTVDGLERVTNGDGRPTGVHVKTKDGEWSEPATLDVDATGPAQMSFHKWLEGAGFTHLPLIKEYDTRMHYEQTVWTLPARLHSEIDMIIPSGLHQGIVYNSLPDWSTGEQRAFVISVYERSQMVLSASGWGHTEGQKTIPEFRIHIKSMVGSERTPPFVFELLNFLEGHEVEISPWAFDLMIGKMSYVPYQDTRGLPSNRVVVGDAVMRLNLIYGE